MTQLTYEVASWPVNASTISPLTFSSVSGGQGSISSPLQTYETWQIAVLAVLASLTSIATIVGNVIVLMSFVLERTIRQPTNYFIASLACSDLLIGSISMPFYTSYLLMGQYWSLGEVLCDLWLSVDYTVCMTSIYTVFCITIDRYCMVKIPAKYRNWRSPHKVMLMVAFTWLIPALVFFTSIFGWQYFTGGRTVPNGRCYVQYMDDALFNLLLQVGYFWFTMIIMFFLYTGIYRVALSLQQRKDNRHKKMTSLVSMAGQTMTQIGIGMSQQQQNRTNDGNIESKPFKVTVNNTKRPTVLSTTTTTTTATTLKSPRTGNRDGATSSKKDDERSSSPAFPSDSEPSSCLVSPNDKRSKKSATSSTGGEKKSGKRGRRTKSAAKKGAEPAADMGGVYVGPPVKPHVFPKQAIAAAKLAADRENEGLLSVRATCFSEPPSTCCPVSEITPPATPETTGSREIVPDSPVWKPRRTSLDATDKLVQDAARFLSEQDVETHATRAQVGVSSTPTARAIKRRAKSQAHANDASAVGGSSFAARTSSLRNLLKTGTSFRLKKRGKNGKNSGGSGGGGSGAGSTNAGSQSAAGKSKSENRARKALRTITIILGAFVFCWTPWHVLSLIIGFCGDCVPTVLYDISYWLCYLNSPINPLCYALANQQFKKTFLRILRRDWHRT